MDKYRLDSHKLIYHVPRVNRWLSGETIYPIYMELSPSGMCNHRCSFCALDFMGYQKRFLKTEIFKERLAEMGRLGVKSIMFGGEGEPFLHKDMVDLAVHTKESGIDVAFTTNGVFLRPEVNKEILRCTSWIKVSINAGTPATYAKVHNTKAADFEKVIDNMAKAAEVRRAENLGCTLGMQILLLPENQHEIVGLAKTAKEIGMDYLVVKPYSQHPSSHTQEYGDLHYEGLGEIQEAVDRLNTPDFKVILRLNAIRKWNEKERGYDRCLALPFWSYIDSGGNVWGCSIYLGDERFRYGNIYEENFQEIWSGERRRESLRWVENEFDAQKCRVNCRMDEINRYLWELKNPSSHVNFI